MNNGFECHIAASLRPVVPNGVRLTAIYSFPTWAYNLKVTSTTLTLKLLVVSSSARAVTGSSTISRHSYRIVTEDCSLRWGTDTSESLTNISLLPRRSSCYLLRLCYYCGMSHLAQWRNDKASGPLSRSTNVQGQFLRLSAAICHSVILYIDLLMFKWCPKRHPSLLDLHSSSLDQKKR
jgi:hypothetical protein